MLKEGNSINLSLTALGMCIKALSEHKKANFRCMSPVPCACAPHDHNPRTPVPSPPPPSLSLFPGERVSWRRGAMVVAGGGRYCSLTRGGIEVALWACETRGMGQTCVAHGHCGQCPSKSALPSSCWTSRQSQPEMSCRVMSCHVVSCRVVSCWWCLLPAGAMAGIGWWQVTLAVEVVIRS